MTCYSSVLSFFFLSVCPSLAAHLKPRLSEAESGVFPILEETNHTEVSQEHGALYSPLHFSISKVGPNYLVVTRAL